MSAYLRLKEFAHFINLERNYDGDHLLHRGDIERMLAVVDAATSVVKDYATIETEEVRLLKSKLKKLYKARFD